MAQGAGDVEMSEYTEVENKLYESFKNNGPVTRLSNYRQSGSKAKWITVGYFEKEPRDNPGRSKEMVECARFTAEGDAHLYANILARRPHAKYWYAVVVR